MNLEILILPVFNGHHMESCSVWEHQASGLLHRRQTSGIQRRNTKGHPSFSLFTHLACNLGSHVLALKASSCYRGQQQNHSRITSASGHARHTVSPLLHHHLVSLCVNGLICPFRQANMQSLASSSAMIAVLPATCPWRKWRCWA